MTLHQLTTFVTVAKHHNVSQAAIELQVCQACVSQQLKALETQCKTKLYRRNGGGVALTREGEIFLRHANVILNELQKLNKQFHVTLPANKAQSLTVGGSFDPSASFLPQLLANFKRSHQRLN